jgi:hypothetical protein
MGIKRLNESGGADEGGEYHGYRKFAHDMFSFDTACPVSTAPLRQESRTNFAASLDHLVGAQDERFRDGYARCFCGLEVEH